MEEEQEKRGITYDPPEEWAPEPKTRPLKDKLDRAARYAAQMLEGVYDWGDRPVPRHNDGTLRAPIAEIMELVWGKRDLDKAYRYFRTRYFHERLALERQRIDGGFHKALAELTDKMGGESFLMRLSGRALELLDERLHDPNAQHKFSNRDLLAIGQFGLTLQAKIQGDTSTRGGVGNQSSLHAALLKTMEKMDPNTTAEMTLKLRKATEEAQQAANGILTIAGGE